MRRSFILAALALAPGCSTTTPSPSISDPDLRDPKAEFDVLRSLAGEWVATGGGAMKTDPFEVRFLVLDGGATVEAVMLGGASKDAVLSYRLDQDHITMIQRPSGGQSLLLPGEPLNVPVVGHTLMRGTWDPETASLKFDQPTREKQEPEPSMHMFGFKPADSAHVDWPQSGRLDEAELDFKPEQGISLVWFYGKTIVQYHLMRKHPPGVERTADHSVPSQTWERVHFDLRDDPAYKAEPH